jgi:hypothetical protein
MTGQLIRMRAIVTWRNDTQEGYVDPGQTIHVTEMRARDLELGGLAVRIPPTSPRVVVREGTFGLMVRPAHPFPGT